MKKTSFFVLILSLSLLSSCGEQYKFKFNSPKKIGINKTLELTVVEKSGKPIDSIKYYLDGITISSNNVNIEDKRLGKHAIKAVVFFDNKEKQLNNTIYFLAAIAPKIYTYKIINTYPHDASAFTQGLEYHNGFIYESTGQRGKSSIRKVELKTGKVLSKKDIDKKYFAEGLTIFDGKLHLLTWQSKKGFVYNLDDFSLIKEFSYGQSKEGWGFTHNSEILIKSDGTERLWFLDPNTLKETHFIEAYTNTRKAERLNEIEYIKGKIYANVWQKSTILIIDPSNGTIEGVVDLRDLDKKVNKDSDDAVLNGIAYDEKTDRLFVTGKDWEKLFEIKIFEKQ